MRAQKRLSPVSADSFRPPIRSSLFVVLLMRVYLSVTRVKARLIVFLCRSKLMEIRLVRFISTKTCLLIYLNRAIRALGWRVSKDESFRQNGKLWRSGSVYQQRRLSRHIIHGKFIHLCTVKLFYFVLCSTVSV